MPTVRDILNEHKHIVARVEESATVLDAARVLSDRHVGALVVTRGQLVVGIFTERDLLNRVVAQEREPASTCVSDVMTFPVACCSPETSRAECRAVMRARRIRHLPVVEGDELLGMISIRDILEDVNAENEQTIRYLYEYMVGEYR